MTLYLFDSVLHQICAFVMMKICVIDVGAVLAILREKTEEKDWLEFFVTYEPLLDKWVSHFPAGMLRKETKQIRSLCMLTLLSEEEEQDWEMSGSKSGSRARWTGE
jgi:hypothetical protein